MLFVKSGTIRLSPFAVCYAEILEYMVQRETLVSAAAYEILHIWLESSVTCIMNKIIQRTVHDQLVVFMASPKCLWNDGIRDDHDKAENLVLR